MKRTTMVLCIALAFSPLAIAEDVQNSMLNAFNSTGNTTKPTSAMTPTRGVMSGGSLQARSEISNVNLFNVRAPKISGGCGGLDLDAGAISFMSSDALVDTAKNVASNGAYLLFQQAISAISDKWATKIDSAVDKMNQWNIQSKSSCEIAEGLIDAAGARMNNSAATGNAQAGGATDQHAATGSNNQSASALAAENSPEVAKALSKNYVWQALDKQEVAGWLGVSGDSSDELREQIMSITGTVVICADSKTSCGVKGATLQPSADGQENQQTAYVPGILRFIDLVEGTTAGKAPIRVYDCGSDKDCMAMNIKTYTTWKTISQQIREVMIGKNGYGGILAQQRIAHKSGSAPQPTTQEKAVLLAASPLVSAASDLNASGQYLRARQLVELFSDKIAADIVYQTMNRTFNLVEASLLVNDPVNGKVAIDHLHQRRQLMTEQYEAYNSIVASRKSVMDFLVGMSQTPSGARRISGPETSGIPTAQ